ncbi:MAG: hypothetical protein GKR89_33835 [Candidatus Latescibacteria bacterium]|nr:hypothetical protein [Candidatus Latescibacterota bacterium]
MLKIAKMGLLALVIGLASSWPAMAQPGGGGGGGRGMMRMMRGGATPEQLIGMLAFDEKFAVSDSQLVELRKVLKEPYMKQRKMQEEMRTALADGGAEEMDWEAVRENMMALRTELMQSVASVLDDGQIETLKKHIQEQQERRGQGGRGGPGGGGGGGGGRWGGDQ